MCLYLYYTTQSLDLRFPIFLKPELLLKDENKINKTCVNEILLCPGFKSDQSLAYSRCFSSGSGETKLLCERMIIRWGDLSLLFFFSDCSPLSECLQQAKQGYTYSSLE